MADSGAETLLDFGRDVESDSALDGLDAPDSMAETMPFDATGVGAPFDASWLPLGATRCLALYHPMPETGVESSKWIPCSSGAPECRRLATPWVPDGAPWALNPPRGELIAGKPVLPHLRVYGKSATKPGTEYAAMLVVEPLDGTPQHALGLPLNAPQSPCSLSSALGGAGVAHAGGGEVYRDAGLLLLVTAPTPSLSKPTVREIPFSVVGPGFPSFGDIWVSDSAGFVAGATYRLFPFELLTATFGTGPSTKAPVAAFPVAAGPGLVVARASPYGFSYVDPSGSVTPLYDIPSGRWDNDHDVDQARARTIVWVESALTTMAAPELWELPFPASGSTPKPRKIRDLSKVPKRIRANDGVVLVVYDDANGLLVRAADGSSLPIKPEAGLIFTEPVWVDAKDFIVGEGIAPSINTATLIRRAVSFK